jgi:hypothetical protein
MDACFPSLATLSNERPEPIFAIERTLTEDPMYE